MLISRWGLWKLGGDDSGLIRVVREHLGDLIPTNIANIGHVLPDRLRHVGQIAQLVAPELLRASTLLLQQQHVLGFGGTTTGTNPATGSTTAGCPTLTLTSPSGLGLTRVRVLLAAILSLAIALIDVSKILQETIAVIGRQDGYLIRKKWLNWFLRC